MFWDYFSAVSQSFYTLIGKARAYGFNLKLWDIAGTLPIANYLGMKLYEHGTTKVYDKISPDYFNNDMGMKKSCVLCYPTDYEEISSLIKPKPYKGA